MHELPPDPDDLLALARRAQGEPDAEVRARVRRGVAGALTAGTVVSLASAAQARGALKSGGSAALATKFAVAAAVCAVAVGLLLRPSTQHAAAPVQPVQRATTAAVAQVVPPSPVRADPETLQEQVAAQPETEAPASPGTAAKPIRHGRRVAAATPSLRAELALLEQAERAIEEADPTRALSLLARHRARFASSSFAQERDGLALIARCMTEADPNAVEATRFLSQAGGGMLHDRVRSACLGPR